MTTLNDSYGYGTKLNTFLWLRIQFSASFTVAGHAIRVNEAFYGCERFFMRFHSYSQLWPSIMHLWEPLAGKNIHFTVVESIRSVFFTFAGYAG